MAPVRQDGAGTHLFGVRDGFRAVGHVWWSIVRHGEGDGISERCRHQWPHSCRAAQRAQTSPASTIH